MRAKNLAHHEKSALRIAYLNAALHRAKTMPKFETLVRKDRPVRLSDIARHFAEAEKKA